KNRFSFSIRDTLADPWSMVDLNFREGGRYAGKVVRLTPFGAFVSLGEGIDGLIHVSKLSRLGSGKAVKHPQDVLEVGQEVLVSIEKIDRDQRRIALVPIGGDAQADEGVQKEEEALPTSYVEKPSSGAGMGTFADLLKNGGKKKRR
ncbi:MAG: S1 RNA-binding domain-containing protein, partial [Deltaproteobacteria bacterium]|nr:S1 RNA-binding domain-containing protein [Deltaproteobacteria bacterium]